MSRIAIFTQFFSWGLDKHKKMCYNKRRRRFLHRCPINTNAAQRQNGA